jgi:hypothetical protein
MSWNIISGIIEIVNLDGSKHKLTDMLGLLFENTLSREKAFKDGTGKTQQDKTFWNFVAKMTWKQAKYMD